MPLFRGIACFSPSVPRAIVQTWAENGGHVALVQQERADARFFFCAGPRDPWVSQLSSKSIVVFHAQWIADSAQKGRLMSMGKYVLDDLFDPSVLLGTETPASIPQQPHDGEDKPRSPSKKRPRASFPAVARPPKRIRFLSSPIRLVRRDGEAPSVSQGAGGAFYEHSGNDDYGDDVDVADEERVALELMPADSELEMQQVVKKVTAVDKHAHLWSTLLSFSVPGSLVSLRTQDVLRALSSVHPEAPEHYDDGSCCEDATALFVPGGVWRGRRFTVLSVG